MRTRTCVVTIVAITLAAVLGFVTSGPASAAEACRNGYVALTFDDGPSTTTASILDALRSAGGARATFFNVGAHELELQDLVVAEATAGQWVGDHTYSHPFLDQMSSEAAYNEILGTQQIHQQLTGATETLFRPPFGRTNAAIRAQAKSLGMTEALWTIDTHDYDGRSTAQIVAAAGGARNGDIVLMHDAGYQTTVAAVPAIVDGLASRGLCAGKVVPTRYPVTAWPGTTFYARAAHW